jgi:hypothetical protein
MVTISLGLVGHSTASEVVFLQETNDTVTKQNKPYLQQLKISSKQLHSNNGNTYCISTFPRAIYIWEKSIE